MISTLEDPMAFLAEVSNDSISVKVIDDQIAVDMLCYNEGFILNTEQAQAFAFAILDTVDQIHQKKAH